MTTETLFHAAACGFALDPLERAFADLDAAEALRAKAIADLALVASEIPRLEAESQEEFEGGELAPCDYLWRKARALDPVKEALTALVKLYDRGALVALRRVTALAPLDGVRCAA